MTRSTRWQDKATGLHFYSIPAKSQERGHLVCCSDQPLKGDNPIFPQNRKVWFHYGHDVEKVAQLLIEEVRETCAVYRIGKGFTAIGSALKFWIRLLKSDPKDTAIRKMFYAFLNFGRGGN